MENDKLIVQQLSRLKKFQILFLTIGLGIAPLSVAVLLVSGSSDAAMYTFFAGVGVTIVASFVLHSSKCPFCHNYFFKGKYWNNVFAQHCMHCKIPINSKEIDVQQHRMRKSKQLQPWESGYFETVEEVEICVFLDDEGTDCWRPVMALPIENDLYQITSINDNPEDEKWQYSRGDIVRCANKVLSDNTNHLVAIESEEAL